MKRSGRTILAVLCFLTLFVILLLLVSHFYLQPGLEAAKHMNHEQLREQAAEAMLVFMLLMTLLVVGLLLTFRISRFFFPRPTVPRTHTKVVDAWAEAGQRMEEESDPPQMDEEEE
jgi:nitric oxide reductase large subunit